LNNYYPEKLKLDRLEVLKKNKSFNFIKIDLNDEQSIRILFLENSFDLVINLAAQAGVRYSLINPKAFIDSNISGFFNILEGCKKSGVRNLIYASSSSVYGNSKECSSETSDANKPISLYAATKRANELMAHSYSHLHGINVTGLRFFTAYGEWGRPDQSLYIFVEAIINKKPLQLFNNGNMLRDFTYVGDIANIINKLINKDILKKKIDLSKNAVKGKFQIFNVGCGKQISLINFIKAIEDELGEKAIKKFTPLQPGDVVETSSNNSHINKYVGSMIRTNLKVGLHRYIQWHKKYYKNKC
jgi:UDP-glucuronate 4-epimerase